MINYLISLFNLLSASPTIPTGENRALAPYIFLGVAIFLIIVVVVLTIIKNKKQ